MSHAADSNCCPNSPKSSSTDLRPDRLTQPRATGMEPDTDYEHDSTFGGDRDSLISSTASLDSELMRYPEEFGRRYHAYQAGAYLFPNDEQELNSMEIEHHNQLLQLDGNLHLCPLTDPEDILDIGTGTGIWALDMADKYPGAQVVGTDLSPVQPTIVSPNCRFEIDDFEQEWYVSPPRIKLSPVFVENRSLSWKVVLQSVPTNVCTPGLSALKPGGYFELSDMECGTFSDDGSVTKEMPSVQWWAGLREAFERVGKPIVDCERYLELMKDAGFET